MDRRDFRPARAESYRAGLEGVTDGAIAFTAYITQVQVKPGQGREAEFNRDLVKSDPRSAETVRAIELRYVV
ncbi:hypothetical protein [Bradyrhizobium sp. B117]|uniref:hypothetical protein n=1 Tax=Bradyrhizobium sp. B117 TaxID=3140246 RepID=UPI003182F68F